MTRKQQTTTLVGLFGLCVSLAILLNVWHPTVAGLALSEAELTRPLSRLLPAERPRLFEWLSVDYAFALLYTVFFTAALRVLAAHTSSTALDVIGRALSWVTAFSIVFDLTENAILWTAANTAATGISPWLFGLVKLKFLSATIFLLYWVIWLAYRATHQSRQTPPGGLP